MTAYDIARGLHILAVIAWMAGLLFLPRLYAYDAEQAAKPEPLRGEMQALLRPWLGDAGLDRDLPLPAILLDEGSGPRVLVDAATLNGINDVKELIAVLDRALGEKGDPAAPSSPRA